MVRMAQQIRFFVLSNLQDANSRVGASRFEQHQSAVPGGMRRSSAIHADAIRDAGGESGPVDRLALDIVLLTFQNTVERILAVTGKLEAVCESQGGKRRDISGGIEAVRLHSLIALPKKDGRFPIGGDGRHKVKAGTRT